MICEHIYSTGGQIEFPRYLHGGVTPPRCTVRGFPDRRVGKVPVKPDTHGLTDHIARRHKTDFGKAAVATVVAVAAGERAGICMIALPTLICSVVAATHAMGVTASVP